MRCVDAISVVRSGLTKPFCIARPASTSSEATITSTIAGLGVSERTGSFPFSLRFLRGKDLEVIGLAPVRSLRRRIEVACGGDSPLAVAASMSQSPSRRRLSPRALDENESRRPQERTDF